MYHCALICCIYIHIHRSVVIGAKKGTADEVVRLDLVGLRDDISMAISIAQLLFETFHS